MLWNLDIISFLLSQNVVKISILWTLHLWQKTALPLDLALYPVSQLEMPSQERKVERYPEKISHQARPQRWGTGGSSIWRPRLRPTAARRVSTCSWHSSAAMGLHLLPLLLGVAVHDVCCSGKPTLPRTPWDASAISYSRLARAARRKCCFCSPALYSRKASICLLNACRNAL